MRVNHDYQFLFIKNHVFMIIHYVMKYIFKHEIVLHFKFTIAAVICKTLFEIFSSSIDLERKMILLKTYNKLNNHREIDISETISHFLEFSNHYINKTFQHIYIIHLLYYFKTRSQKDFFHNNSDIFDIDS